MSQNLVGGLVLPSPCQEESILSTVSRRNDGHERMLDSTCMNSRNQSSNGIVRKVFTFSALVPFRVRVSRPDKL